MKLAFFLCLKLSIMKLRRPTCKPFLASSQPKIAGYYSPSKFEPIQNKYKKKKRCGCAVKDACACTMKFAQTKPKRVKKVK